MSARFHLFDADVPSLQVGLKALPVLEHAQFQRSRVIRAVTPLLDLVFANEPGQQCPATKLNSESTESNERFRPPTYARASAAHGTVVIPSSWPSSSRLGAEEPARCVEGGDAKCEDAGAIEDSGT